MENQNKDYIIQTSDDFCFTAEGNDYHLGGLSIEYGSFVNLEGKNGIGKSTLLKVFIREQQMENNRPSERAYWKVKSGKLFIQGKNIFDMDKSELKRRMVYVEQEDNFLQNESPYKALIRPSIIALQGQHLYNKANKNKINEIVNQYFNEYLYDIFKTKMIHEKKAINTEKDKNYKTNVKFMYGNVHSLSGGQQKFIHILQGIIKTIVTKNKIILMDEPLNNLDKDNKKKLRDLIVELREKEEFKDLTIIIITHCRVFLGVNSVIKLYKENETDNEVKYELGHEYKYFKCLD